MDFDAVHGRGGDADSVDAVNLEWHSLDDRDFVDGDCDGDGE